MTRAVRVRIEGHVQGVYYRATTKRRAEDTGVTGWVRNRTDGCVEAHLEGDPDAIDAMVAFCHTGSPAAEVTDVEVTEVTPEGFDTFAIRR